MAQWQGIKPVGQTDFIAKVQAGRLEKKADSIQRTDDVKGGIRTNEAPVDNRLVDESIQQVSGSLKLKEHNLKMEYDKPSGMVIIRVMDSATGEILKQFPPDQIVQMAMRLNNYSGLFKGKL
jgi:uncharacterized FlaG/YvyC family protein